MLFISKYYPAWSVANATEIIGEGLFRAPTIEG
jgi:hypothetical protein